MVNISHAVGVSNRHKAKPGEENGNGCFKHRSTMITYTGCIDLVYGYHSWDLDERRSTSSYVLNKCTDMLGKFGHVQDVVFCGGQSVLQLNNSPTYRNGTSASIYKTGYWWRQNVPYWSESWRHVHVMILLEKLWSYDGVWLLLACRKGDELINDMIY